VGLITTAKQAEEILQNHDADLIFVAREILRNPYIANSNAQLHQEDCYFPPQYERAKLKKNQP
jgi:2,4-dienoyl-CoA reductase-like NADH-dependent reductase (Old Yellow Enzyme family)